MWNMYVDRWCTRNDNGCCWKRDTFINIPWSSFFDHLNGKTESKKMGLGGVLITKEDVEMIKWTLAMQECGLSINL
jgi:hypothetical protein